MQVVVIEDLNAEMELDVQVYPPQTLVGMFDGHCGAQSASVSLACFGPETRPSRVKHLGFLFAQAVERPNGAKISYIGARLPSVTRWLSAAIVIYFDQMSAGNCV